MGHHSPFGRTSNMEEALNSKDVKWEMAMQEEYDSFVVNNTWSLVPFPKGRKPISCKWVFKIKHGVHGEVECYKARIVARGFTQTFGVDYNETFAHVAKFVSICCILALTAIEDMEIHQMDVKIAFLNGDLEKKIYMEQPERFYPSFYNLLVLDLQIRKSKQNICHLYIVFCCYLNIVVLKPTYLHYSVAMK